MQQTNGEILSSKNLSIKENRMDIKYKLKGVRAWNEVSGIKKVIHSINLTMVLKDGEKILREETRPVNIMEEDDLIDATTFTPMPEKTSTQTEKDDFEAMAIGWAKAKLASLEVPDPDGEFNTDTIDQLSLWKRSITETIENDGAHLKQRTSKEYKL